MAEETQEKPIGWYNDEDVVLCPQCFEKYCQSKDLNKGVEWYPIKKEKGEEKFDECDECGKKL